MTDKSMQNSRIDIVKSYWQPVAVFALFVFIQWPVLNAWWYIWDAPDSYYSHGPLVPLIAAFMIWTRRAELASAKRMTNWYGALLLAVSLPVHTIAMIMEVRSLYMLSFFGTLFGTVLLLFGWRVLRVLFVPLAFLITMIPIADSAIDSLTGNAQLISAAVAERFFMWSGYEVQRYGNTIASSSLPHPLLVGSPCSGLRLLISLITFSWFFLFVTNGRWWKKALLMVLTFPLAVFINSLRIAMIGYVGFWTDSGEYMAKFHDYSGYIGLVLCFLILFGIAKLIRVGETSLGTTAKEMQNAGHNSRVVFASSALLVVVIGLTLVGLVGNFVRPLYDLSKGELHRQSIPRAFGDWTSTELPIDENTKRILGKGDLMSLLYTNGVTNRTVTVFLDAALDTSAFHDPHLCLTGAGSTITSERQLDVHFEKPVDLSVRATEFDVEADYSNAVVLHWYMYGKRSFPLTGDVGRVRQANIRSDLLRIVANPFSLRELRKEVRNRQFIWYRFSTEAYNDDETDYRALEDFAREFVARKKDFGD